MVSQSFRQSSNEAKSEEERTAYQIETEIRESILRTHRLRLREQINRCRPSVILRPQLERCHDDRGNWYWLASYGDLYSFGETPELAYQEFDRAWVDGI